jgi:hypothetical protein
MATALLYLMASLLVFLILTEIVTINIKYDNRFVVKINLMIFAVQISQSAQSESTASLKKKKRKRPAILRLYKSAYRLIGASDIFIRNLTLKIASENPISYALTRGTYLSVISAGMAMLSSTGRNFKYGNIIVTSSVHNKTEVTVNANIKCSLVAFLYFCISLVIGKRKGK